MRVTRVLSMFLFGVVTTSRLLTADTIAVLPGSGGFENANYGSDVTLGWEFSLSVPLTVTGLAYFDADDGLADSHPIGIWDSLGNLVVEATVPSGLTDLVSGFEVVPITPITLDPATYTIGGYGDVTSTDAFEFQVPTITTVAGLSFVQRDLFTQGTTLTEPLTVAHVFTDYGYFGPDFLVGNSTNTTVDAPEPRSMLLVLLGVAALAVLRRGRRLGLSAGTPPAS